MTAFDPNPNHTPVRDKTYPSQIAAERPKLTTRIHCQDQPDPNDALSGGEQPMHTESACERFNNSLRHGHADRER